MNTGDHRDYAGTLVVTFVEAEDFKVDLNKYRFESWLRVQRNTELVSVLFF
jgi:hypothetical protein